jgi:hypothetical protein
MRLQIILLKNVAERLSGCFQHSVYRFGNDLYQGAVA